MPDISDELQRIADDAARSARPLAAAEVIRRGDRRRRRTIAQQSLSGLSIAGVAAAVIFTGAASGAPTAPAASGAAGRASTVTETTSSPAGEITITVKYQTEQRRHLKLLSVTYSGGSRGSAARPVLVFAFGPPATPGQPSDWQATQSASPRSHLVIFLIKLSKRDLRDFTGSLPLRDIRAVNRNGLIDGQELRTAIADEISHTPHQITLLPLVRQGLIFAGAP